MIKILFICHGNICRSAMAEDIMNDLIRSRCMESEIEVASAAISSEEIGNPIYPPARKVLEAHGIIPGQHSARLMTKDDYWKYSSIICMDEENISGAIRICGDDISHKLHLLMSYAGSSREVSDPWYTRDFEAAWKDIDEGCIALMDALAKGINSNSQ